MTFPKETYYVTLSPHPVTKMCYKCKVWTSHGFDLALNTNCDVCGGKGSYIITDPHRMSQRKTDTQRLYSRRAGALSLKRAHEKCCDVQIFKATTVWEPVDDA